MLLVLLVLGQEGRGWLLVVEGRRWRRARITDGAGVVVPDGVLRLPHPVGVGVHGDQGAVALGVSEVSRGLADGTGETAEDGAGDQSTGSPQSVGAAHLLRLAVAQTELTSLSTRHPASCTLILGWD